VSTKPGLTKLRSNYKTTAPKIPKISKMKTPLIKYPIPLKRRPRYYQAKTQLQCKRKTSYYKIKTHDQQKEDPTTTNPTTYKTKTAYYDQRPTKQ
jgi:hypothetical protein